MRLALVYIPEGGGSVSIQHRPQLKDIDRVEEAEREAATVSVNLQIVTAC